MSKERVFNVIGERHSQEHNIRDELDVAHALIACNTELAYIAVPVAYKITVTLDDDADEAKVLGLIEQAVSGVGIMNAVVMPEGAES